MSCNWMRSEYFSQLLYTDKRAHGALEMLVDDLHCEKEKTISCFLCHSGSEDFLWGLVKLLGNENYRVAGNSAYIIGTLAESELGCLRVLSLAKSKNSESHKILHDLTKMLTFDDSESVMNAAGTMGTLAESHAGREWILSESCLPNTLEFVTNLLQSENMWTASNAALVLARLSISEDGCKKILVHENVLTILSKLVVSLGVDEAGRGMNAAFAIGRLCDMEDGRKQLLSLPESEKMLPKQGYGPYVVEAKKFPLNKKFISCLSSAPSIISSLAKMLSCEDTGASKNACFALSCLATNTEGHTRLLSNVYLDSIIKTLGDLLFAEDSETGWFAAMTLRTLASQPRGCLKIRDHPSIIPALKGIQRKDGANSDLKEEVEITLDILKRLDKPNPPSVQVTGSTSVEITWDEVKTKSGLEVRYIVHDGAKGVYAGKERKCVVNNLQPNTQYSYKLKLYTEGDESPYSESVSITTDETGGESPYSESVSITTDEIVPGPPVNLKILGCTITQLKIGWDPPENFTGFIKGYYIYQGDSLAEHTTETTCIITGLMTATSYELQVCAAGIKGKGERATVVGATSELGAHAPSKPSIQVMGRNEMHVTWQPPEVPLGRITRYDLVMNNKILYSGTDLSYTARRLTPDTDYNFTVTALTNEGKFESKATKKRTPKDEYDSHRQPLYQVPKKDNEEKKEVTKKNKATNTESKKLKLNGSRRSSKVSENSDQSSRPSSEKITTSSPNQSNKTEQEIIPKPSAKSPSPSKSTTSPTKLEVKDYRKDDKPCEKKSRPVSNHSSKRSPDPLHNQKFSVKELIPPLKNIKSEKHIHNTSKGSFPVSLSYVSIHGGADDSIDPLRSFDSDAKHSLRRTKTLIESNGFSQTAKPLKLERAKTVLVPSKSAGPKQKGKGQISPLPHEESSSKSEETSASVACSNSAIKEPEVLPKPTLPNQQYLRGVSNSWGTWPVTSSQNNSKDSEMENDLKRHAKYPSFETISHLTHQYNHVSSDSTYSMCGQNPNFLQRANTFMNTHRPSQKRSYEKSSPNKKLTSSSGARLINSATVGHSNTNFVPDIPDDKVQMKHNKFVPMQLRTQPSNLRPEQLQRVNTTLHMETKGPLARRLESLTRSHTQVELKSSRSSIDTTTSVPLSAQHSSSKSRKSEEFLWAWEANFSLKNKPLGAIGETHNGTTIIKEPDSVILRKSWGQSSVEGSYQGTLQSTR